MSKSTAILIPMLAKLMFLLVRVVILFIAITATLWIMATPIQRSHYLSWVPTLVESISDYDLRHQLALGPDLLSSTRVDQPPDSNPDPGLEQRSHPFNHLLLDHSLCEQLKGSETETVSKTFYQWRDAQGRAQFGDRPPADASNLQTVSTKTVTTTEYFKLNINREQARLPAFASDRFDSEIRGIYRILQRDIRVDNLRKINLTLTLFDRHADYSEYQQVQAPNLSNQSTGFFNPRRGEAAIFTANYAPQTFAITRHEATHAILTGLFGIVPIWFNEGMAEYFENMQMSGQSRVINANQRHLQQLRTALANRQLPALQDYLLIKPTDWYVEEALSLRYSTAWSIVYYLLSDSQRKEFVRQMMNHWGERYCVPFDAIGYFNANYPGGIDQFESEWKTWIGSSIQTAHRY